MLRGAAERAEVKSKCAFYAARPAQWGQDKTTAPIHPSTQGTSPAEWKSVFAAHQRKKVSQSSSAGGWRWKASTRTSNHPADKFNLAPSKVSTPTAGAVLNKLAIKVRTAAAAASTAFNIKRGRGIWLSDEAARPLRSRLLEPGRAVKPCAAKSYLSRTWHRALVIYDCLNNI